MWRHWREKIHWDADTVIVQDRLSAVETLLEVARYIHHGLCSLCHSSNKSRLFLTRLGPDGEQFLTD